MNILIQKQHVEQLYSNPLSSRVSHFQLPVPVLPRVLVSDSWFPTPYIDSFRFRIRVSRVCQFLSLSFRIRVS